MQLRFASFAVINLREDLHLQECARAGRTKKIPLKLEPQGYLIGGATQSRTGLDGFAIPRLVRLCVTISHFAP